MRKQIHYKTCKSRTEIDTSAPPLKRQRGKRFAVFLLTFIMSTLFAPNMMANLFDDTHEKPEIVKLNKDEGFLEFKIPAYEGNSATTTIQEASILLNFSGTTVSLFDKFQTFKNGNFKFNLDSDMIGKLAFYNTQSAKWDFPGKSEYSNTSNNSFQKGAGDAYFIHFRYYYTSFKKFFININVEVDNHVASNYNREWDSPTQYPELPKITMNSGFKWAYNTSDFTKVNVSGTTQSGLSSNVKTASWMGTLDPSTKGTYSVSSNKPSSFVGGINIDRGETFKVDYYWTQDITSNPMKEVVASEKIEIPAYHQAKNFKAVYNVSTGNVNLSWSIDKSLNSTNYEQGDNFEIEASPDADFSKPANIRQVGSVAFKIGIVSYSLPDNVAEYSNNKNMYYRIRRTKLANTLEWNLKQTTSTALELIKHANISDCKAELDNTGVKAIITWTANAAYWSPQTKMLIDKRNTQTGATLETFELDKDKWLTGKYEDSDIAACIQYEYRLQVKPGSSIFTTGAYQKANGEVFISEIGKLKSISASKGYYPERVSLVWEAEGKFDQFVIRRVVYGEKTDTVQIGLVDASSSNLYTYDDTKGIAGTYYTYLVHGLINCGGKNSRTNETLSDIGFRNPQGNIYGSVTYENGQAVENVEIRLEQDGNSITSGQSMHLQGSGSLKVDKLNSEFINGNEFAFQAWIKPNTATPKNEVLYYREGQYEVGFDNVGDLYLKHKNSVLASTKYVFDNTEYNHISVTNSADSAWIYVGDSLLLKKKITLGASTNASEFYLGSSKTTKNYKGYIDEVRLWNRSLTAEEVARDYDRLIAGNEDGLAAYYRFDETVKESFYDISNRNDKYNENHGSIAGNIEHSTTTPDNYQLSLKGITNVSGNYFINGIPYTGNGTQYKIIPRMGTHQFDPTHHTRFIGGGSLSHDVSFKDKSSFPVSGTVYYSGSTIPVEGVMFKIDGTYASEKGKLLTSGPDGTFSISVPVGYHEVVADKPNHVFENGGRITDSNGDDLNYQGRVAERILFDATTVRFIGRVAGGSVQEEFILGHSLSRNNLGDSITIQMSLIGGDNKKIVTKDTTVNYTHLKPTNSKEPAYTNNVDFTEKGITIKPNSTTGEFIVDLIPEKYLISSVLASGHRNILEQGNMTLDLTSKLILQNEVNTILDSVLISKPNQPEEYSYSSYNDTVYFHDSHKFIKRVNPEISIDQIIKGQKVDFYGNDSITTTNLLGEKLVTPIYDKDTRTYIFKNPVFTQNSTYKFQIEAFERYTYFDKDGNIKSETRVPTTDGVVKIDNSLRFGEIGTDEVELNEKGIGYYSFSAGEPDLGTTGLKTFSAKLSYSGTILPWTGNDLKAFITGMKSTGNDIVTAGPNRLISVLRDPPGSNSYAYLEKGTTFTSSSKRSETVRNDGSVEFKNMAGADVTTTAGSPFFSVQTTLDTTNELGGGVDHHEEYEWGGITNTKTTITEAIRTSDSPDYVGDLADVLIGNSTNITYGVAQTLTVISKDQEKNDDEVLVSNGNYLLVRRDALSTGSTFGTMFAYPQIHIEKVLIPNLLKLRNDMIRTDITPSQAQSLATSSNKAVYVSNLAFTDKNYGASNNDSDTFGAEANVYVDKTGPSYTIYYPNDKTPDPKDALLDSVHFYNQTIQNWKDLLFMNEKAKLDVGEKELHKNYTFHGASNVEYSREYSFESGTFSNFEVMIDAKAMGQTGLAINGFGFLLSVTETFGAGHNSENEDTTEETRKEGFVLAEEGTDYISVDVYYEKNPNYEDYDLGGTVQDRKGPFIYRTRGGATSCPYEGGYVSKYYKPGSRISEPTMRIEVPSISVNKKTIANVPSNRKAVFELKLENNSETKDDAYFILNVLDGSNPHGAVVSIDGMALGSNGRTILVPYEEGVIKTLEVACGPNELNYENLQLVLHSQCQYDPTDWAEDIADTLEVSAYFIPSCSDINIKGESGSLDKWVVNTNSKTVTNPISGITSYALPIVLDKYDVNHSNFERIELQWKQDDQPESGWATERIFYIDPKKAEGKSNAEAMDLSASEIKYDFVLTGIPDSKYNIRAVTVCRVGADEILTYSDVATGTKDTQRPLLFGSAQPANGVLGINDQILLNFNEEIKEGALARSNFQVTGIRNGAKTDHGVSILFDGVNDYVSTEAEKNLIGKDLTVEMFVYRDAEDAATLFSHGNINEYLDFGFSDKNRLEVRMGDTTVESSALTLNKGEWAHVAMVYDANSETVSAFYNYVEVMRASTIGEYKGVGNIEFGRSIANNNAKYFKGKMHEVRLWDKKRSSADLQINSMKTLTGLESGLLAYYPMSEGKYATAFDKARGANAEMQAEWSTPAGKAATFDGASSLNMFAGSTIAIDDETDYTIEFWFKADKGQTNASILTNEPKETDQASLRNRFFVGFNNSGELVFRSNGNETVVEHNTGNDYRDNNWHHFAVSVNRIAQKTDIYVDDQLTNQISSTNIGGIGSDYITAGARYSDPLGANQFDMFFKGSVDEIRVWNTYLNQDLITQSSNSRQSGIELGLVAYDPFEEYIEFQNNKEMKYTLKDMKVQTESGVKVPEATAKNVKEENNTAPIKDRGPVENLSYNYVVSDKSLLINMDEPLEMIEKAIVKFTVEDVQDQFGNKIKSPITWSAYIDRNLLKWSDDRINIIIPEYVGKEFSVDISNNGGSMEKFTLENLPQWLTATPMMATISPKGKQTIEFVVDEALNVGSYSEVVYMRNSNNVTEPLEINVKVEGERPNWSVDPGKYEFNMSVYGQLRVNNIISKDKEDMIAAFIDNECVGVVSNTYHAKTDRWFAFLTVYGNKANANAPVEFRIWDASTGKVYGAKSTEDVTFRSQHIYGTSGNPLIFDTSELLFQNIKLNSGWNWVSFHVSNNSMNSVQATLGNIWKSGDHVKDEEYADNYSTTLGWTGTLSKPNRGFNNKSMFMLKSAEAKEFSVVGSELNLKSTPIDIKGQKWSYISYLPSVNMKIDEALADYQAKDGDVIKSQGTFSMYNNGVWVGNLNYLEPGKGYMLYRGSADNTSFKYPTVKGSMVSPRIRSTKEAQSVNYAYANNMTIVATVDKAVELEDGDRIVAYINDENRGEGIVNSSLSDDLLFMNIASDNSAPVTFALERGGLRIAQASNILNYNVNQNVGTIAEPYALNFDTSVSLADVYPNPFKSELKINLRLTEKSKVEISIYDLTGMPVKSWSPQVMESGVHQISWDATSITSGTYIVNVKVNDRSSNFEVIKQ